ncbi:MAG: DnaA regulatory inactivator Hda [Thiohalomonadaceae bacterium]
MSASQLALRLALPDSATLANFHMGDNGALLHALKSDEPFIYLWGNPGAGKSHLLQAACHAAADAGDCPAYLPLRDLIATDPEVFEGLEAAGLVCLDDVDAIAGRQAWEQALFHLYNRVRDAGGRMLATGPAAPAGLDIRLPDLVSRLSWGPVFQLHALDDEGKMAALRARARARGLELSEDVAAYLMRRFARDPHSLFALLDRIDAASLVAKRRITIPFLRELLG